MIRYSAFRMAQQRKNVRPVDLNEAYYKVLDALNNFGAVERHLESHYAGARVFNIV
jgi:hypothetical protein